MLIDWFTVLAQIVNFLILMALVRMVLFKPIRNVMRRRREAIEKRLSEAEEKNAQAESKQQEYERKLEELDQQRDQKLEEAAAKAEEKRKELVEDAHKKVDSKRQAWLDALARDQEEFLRRLERNAAAAAGEVATALLAELADEEMGERVIDALLKRLDELGENEAQAMEDAVAKCNCITVRSGSEIPSSRRSGVTTRLRKRFGDDLKVDYETAKDLAPGAELMAEGYSLEFGARPLARAYGEKVVALLAEADDAEGQAATKETEAEEEQ